MIIILIFLILTPGLISLLIHRELISKKNKTLETVATYSIYSFCIILIIYIILYFGNPNKDFVLSINNDSDLFRALFSLKYMVLALNAAVILPAILYIIKIVNWFLKKQNLLKTQKSTDFILNDFSKQINEYVFGNADFYLNLSENEFQDLVLFINKTFLLKGKLYLFAPEYDLKVNINRLDIEKTDSKNISSVSVANNDALLLIGDQIQENITTKFQSRVFKLSFEKDNLNNDNGKFMLLPNHFSEQNQNTKYIEEVLLQSLLDFVFTLIQ
jgi:hypothetical protein